MGKRGGKGKAKTGKLGSWIIDHDVHGFPFWTNNVTQESTYNLFVERSAMMARAVGNGNGGMDAATLPPYRHLAPVPAPKYTKGDEQHKEKGKYRCTSCEEKYAGNHYGREKRAVLGWGLWEQIWKEDGSRIWMNRYTKEVTCKDPFY